MAATKKEEIEMVTILYHENETSKSRSNVSFLRVPKSWVDEDGVSPGGTVRRGSGYWGSDMDKSAVLRRLGACKLRDGGLTPKDRMELRRVLPNFPEYYPSGKYEWMPPAELSMRDDDWHLHPVYCVYNVEHS